MNVQSFPSYLEDFKDYLESRRLTEVSVKGYLTDLGLFFKFLLFDRGIVRLSVKEDELISKIRSIDLSLLTSDVITGVLYEDVTNYMSFCAKQLQNSDVTQARKIAAISAFYNYMQERGLVKKNPAKGFKISITEKSMKHLEVDQVARLVDVIRSYDGKYKERNQAIMYLFMDLGIRLSELCNINCEDIHGDWIVIHGKGKKEREMDLNNTCIQAIQEYARVRPAPSDIKKGHEEAFFLSQHKRRITPRMVIYIVEEFLSLAGINKSEKTQKFTAHKLRHTFGTLMVDIYNIDVRDLQRLMGHNDVNTTMRYTHSDRARRKEIMRKATISGLGNNP